MSGQPVSFVPYAFGKFNHSLFVIDCGNIFDK